MDRAPTPPAGPSFALVGVWALAVLAGFVVLWIYSARPGAKAETPGRLTADLATRLGLEVTCARPRLVLAVHPRCPCTRATVRELARALPEPQGEPAAPAGLARRIALVYQPAEAGADDAADAWLDSDLVRDLRRQRFTILPDPDGRLGRRLGALTSGHVVVFDRDGHTEFSGGVTPGRGHESGGVGLEAVRAALRSEPVPRDRAAVFGCPLTRLDTCLDSCADSCDPSASLPRDPAGGEISPLQREDAPCPAR